ncbi:MAG TPA: galactokinase family protein [Gemmatimonadaceae bacterium]
MTSPVWRVDASRLDAHAGFFRAGERVAVARAPGRLDLMGGIADYSGSLVLELPLDAAAIVAAQASDEDRVTVRTLAVPDAGAETEVTVPLAALAPGGLAVDYDAARALLAADPRRRWAAYLVGALVVLGRERGMQITRGVRLLVDSTVPPAKGVSSSAALEVAAMQALCALHDVTLDGRELALLCQRVENLVVGAPCGVMDQMTAACGRRDRLLALLCQPAELQGHVALPPGLELWGIDSGIRHEVSGADYGSVRVGAFMGWRILTELAGPETAARWRGHLANVTPSEWEGGYREAVPEIMEGAAFLERYHDTGDSVTRVDPARTYAVGQPTAHPIHEHHRVRLFRALLEAETSAPDEERRLLLGELMYQSHASYGACGLGSSGTDHLVALVRAAGPAAGLYGAKITGGGSGGVVALLARAGSREIVDAIARRYERDTGRGATVLGGSSDGAIGSGVRWLDP